MTIHFNPSYDKEAYLDLASRGGMLFGEKVVGPIGLLSELEERLGIAGVSESDVERVVNYVKAMRRNLEESPDQFYEESFRNDEIGTARTLLHWRRTSIAPIRRAVFRRLQSAIRATHRQVQRALSHRALFHFQGSG